jgi:hypothetical protein
MKRPLPPGAGLPVLVAVLAAGAAQAQPLHRFALFVGNNAGGEGTQPLRYAGEDARRLHDVFSRLGGVRPEDALLLLDQGADDVLTALGELERRSRDARARGERTALVLYFSGHVTEGALRLGATRLALEAVKVRLAEATADVRLAVFDACRSGAVARTKGVRRAPAFEVETDATRATHGLVILTSSAADEDSQESDLIAGSYFTYHLATGLLGSADQSGDGRVTLAEAYAYAYERTLAATADSAAGPQHPTFSFELAGNGDLILTDLLERREGLRLPASAPSGTYLIVSPRGLVVAETLKAEGERLIALPPGSYTLKRRLVGHLRLGAVQVRAGEVTVVDEAGFRDAKFSDDPVKGAGVTGTFSRHWSLSVTGGYQAVFDRPTESGGYFPSAPLVGAEATLHNFFGQGFSLAIDGLYGWSAGTVTSALLGAQAYQYTLLSGGAAVLYEWGQDGTFIPYGGVHLSFNFMSRAFTDPTLASQTYSVFTPGAFVGLKVRLTHGLSVVARVRGHYLLYNVDESRNLGSADFGLLFDYEFRE